MPQFVGHEEFVLAYISGTRWRVKEGFTYWLNRTEYVDVCRGFETDFASIPRLLKVFWPSPGGLWDLPAVVHDALYQRGYVRNIHGGKRNIGRSEADRIFRDGMGVMGVRRTAIWTLWSGVRSGGWLAWRRHRQRDGETAKVA